MRKKIKAWAIIGEKGFSHIAFKYKDAITWEGCTIIPLRSLVQST